MLYLIYFTSEIGKVQVDVHVTMSHFILHNVLNTNTAYESLTVYVFHRCGVIVCEYALLNLIFYFAL